MLTVCLQGRIAADHQEIFKEFMQPDWTLLVWDPAIHQAKEFVDMAARADVIVGGSIPMEQWPSIPRLKLFQIPWTGFNFTSPERMPDGIPVANCFQHESAIAEYVMLAMLEWQIGLREIDDRFRREGWGGRYPAGGLFHNEIRDKTLGIYGYGHIGRAVARRAKAFDMRVMGIRRSKLPCPAELDWLGTPEQFSEMLAVSDFLLLACDLNDHNISRGGVVDELALFQALQSRSIGGAIIDVWYNYNAPGKEEVWPANHPFQDLDNVILSAHESGWTEAQLKRRWEFVANNIRRIERGEAAENIVFTGTQKVISK